MLIYRVLWTCGVLYTTMYNYKVVVLIVKTVLPIVRADVNVFAAELHIRE